MLVLAGCGGSQHGGSSTSGQAAAAPAIGTGNQAAGSSGGQAASGAGNSARSKAATPQTPLLQRDILRTATLNMTVRDVDQAATKALAATEAAGGRADGDNRDSDAGGRHAELVLRVPPAKLDSLMATVVGLGHENSRTVQGVDVTASHADVTARVKALTISVGRLQDYLQHSGSITDLVTLEDQLSQRQSDLDSTVAQQRALEDQIGLATLTVDLSTVTPPVHHAGSGPSGFGSALIGALHALVLVLRWSAAIAGYLLPFALIAALIAVLVGVPISRYRRQAGRRPVQPVEPATVESQG